jgi:hypothetical protein
MCQQWFSVVGLFLDVVGFLLIAWEWRHMFFRERDRRMDQYHYDYERKWAEIKGETYNDPRAEEATQMAELFWKLFVKEWRGRAWLFYSGAALVILGFLAQTAGSWPGGLLSFKNC